MMLSKYSRKFPADVFVALSLTVLGLGAMLWLISFLFTAGQQP